MNGIEACYEALSDLNKAIFLQHLARVAKSDETLDNSNLRRIIGLCCGYSHRIDTASETITRVINYLEGMAAGCWEHTKKDKL